MTFFNDAQTIKLKHIFSLIVTISILIWGIYNLADQIIQIFHRYPEAFNRMLKSHNTSFRILLLQQILFISLSNFVTSAYALAMLVKPSHVVKLANIIVMLLLVTITIYFNQNYQLTPEFIGQFQ